MSDEEESEPLAYKSPDLDIAQSRLADTFSLKGSLIKPDYRYSPHSMLLLYSKNLCWDFYKLPGIGVFFVLFFFYQNLLQDSVI